MNRKWMLTFVLATGLTAACEKAGPTAPATPAAAAQATGATVEANIGDACAVDVGPTTSPLPALHFMEAMFGLAAQQSGVNCGGIRSLDTKLEAIARALDQNPRNFHAACGASGALLNELEAMLRTGKLQNITFPAPAPGAPTTLLGLAEELNGNWCAAARGERVGPAGQP